MYFSVGMQALLARNGGKPESIEEGGGRPGGGTALS